MSKTAMTSINAAAFVLLCAALLSLSARHAATPTAPLSPPQDCEEAWPGERHPWPAETAPVSSATIAAEDRPEITFGQAAPQGPGVFTTREGPPVDYTQPFSLEPDFDQPPDTLKIVNKHLRIVFTIHEDCDGHLGDVALVACGLDDDMPLLFGCGGTSK